MADPLTTQFTLGATPLTMLLIIATIGVCLNVALEQIFQTRLYQAYLGKGLDAPTSKFFSNFDLRPWIAMGCGITLAFGFNLQYFASSLAIDPTALPGSSNMLDQILTGLLVSGGAKTYQTVKKRLELLKG